MSNKRFVIIVEPGLNEHELDAIAHEIHMIQNVQEVREVPQPPPNVFGHIAEADD